MGLTVCRIGDAGDEPSRGTELLSVAEAREVSQLDVQG